jgi:ribosomal protein L37AE/L43A
MCTSCSTREAISGGLCGRCESEQQRLGRLDYPAHAQHSDNPRPESGRNHERRVQETRQHLGELPEMYAQLWMFSEPGSAPKDPDQRSGKSNPAHRSVVNLDVLDLTDERLKDDAEDMRTDYGIDSRAGARRQGVVNTLAAWCRLVDEERRGEYEDDGNFPADSVELSEDPTISSECGYLLHYLDWIAEHQWFDDEMHPDVKQIWSDVRRVCGVRDPIGYECPTCQWLVVPRYDHTVYACTGCERTWTMANEVDAFLADQTSVMSLPDCARWIGKPLQNLNYWKTKGYILPVGFDRKRKRDLFDVRLVQRVADMVQNGKKTDIAG